MTYISVMFPDNRIRELRKRAGLTQGELGEAIGLHQTQIGKLESAGRNLTFEWARRIAKELDVTMADLLGEDDNPDRLSPEERELIQRYRAAPIQQRELVERVAEPTASFTPEPPEKTLKRA